MHTTLAAHPYRSCNAKKYYERLAEKRLAKTHKDHKEKRQRHSTYRPLFICMLYAKPTLEYNIRPVPES